MEGIWTNYPMFEKTLQLAWKPTTIAPPPPLGPCDWGDEVKGSYLANTVPSAGGQFPYDDTKLEAAQAWCCQHDDCGGVTLQDSTYQVRATTQPIHDCAGPLCATGSWPRKSFAPNQGGAGLHEWFTKYGTRRYGSTDPSAVKAWELLGSTIYAGQGGGFGGPISGVPVLPAPPAPPGTQPPGPPAPAGFTRKHPQDGYWNPPPNVAGRMTVDACSKKCTALKPAGFPGIKCEAFEVYVDSPPSTGNCYLFTSMKGPFTPLAPSRTYIRTLDTAMGGNGSVDAMYATAPGTLAQRTAATNLANEYPGCDAATDADAPILEAWSLLLAAADKLGSVASFRFDLIDVGRQAMSAHFGATFNLYRAAFLKNDTKTCTALEATCMTIIDDYDALLSTDTNFMLGR